jgi:hypothetical protein
MEEFLAICTVLGGISAVWFFWDKIVLTVKNINFTKPDRNVNFLSLSDNEFMLVDKLLKLPDPNEYFPVSSSENDSFSSLANQGYFKKTNNGSYVPTIKFKQLCKNASLNCR